MSSGIEFVASEVLDFAVENPLHAGLFALLSVYFALEAAGYGIICRCLYNRRVRKFDDDLKRVRELQEQLGTLRTVRASRKTSVETSNETETPKKGSQGAADGSTENTDEAASTTSSTATNDESERTDENPTENSQKIVADDNKKDIPEHAATNAYESVKDAWTWGRHETPFSPLLGFAEGLTVSTAAWFGTDMKGIDDALKPHVKELDGHVANILSGMNQNPDTESASSDKKE